MKHSRSGKASGIKQNLERAAQASTTQGFILLVRNITVVFSWGFVRVGDRNGDGKWLKMYNLREKEEHVELELMFNVR
jgi:hypothetical protein